MALPRRRALLPGVPHDLAAGARSFFGPTFDAGRAPHSLCVAGLSTIGTILVESPFLLHLAGTSQWQRFVVLGLGFGIIIASAVILLLRRRSFSPTQACFAGLNTAYLANLSLILVVYSDASGSFSTRSGWYVSMVIVWPMVLELVWLLAQALRTGPLAEA